MAPGSLRHRIGVFRLMWGKKLDEKQLDQVIIRLPLYILKHGNKD